MNFKKLLKNKELKYISNSSKETKELAKNFVREVAKQKREKALIAGLKGELGGGKTTFLQGFAEGLEVKEKVLSPTFVLMKKYRINYKESKFDTFYHLDCYRINNLSEIKTLNFKKIIQDPKNLVAIEWFGKIEKEISKKRDNIFEINFKFIDKNKREIKILLK